MGYDARDPGPDAADDLPATVDVSVLIPILNEGAYLNMTVSAMLD